ncbi:MAG: hypothetical protein J6S53_03065 [Lentisphaeria bacterium]|nr:hypothetical protein [Lentisphaeria bacterium]
MQKLFILLAMCSLLFPLYGKQITLVPENILILSGKENLEEANDLAYHFELITGKKNTVRVKDLSCQEKDKYIFRFVYNNSPGAARGNCTVKIGEKETVLEGRMGAAYWFLQKNLSVKWVRPGEKALSILRQRKSSCKPGKSVMFRH